MPFYYATCTRGLESTLEAEIRALGGQSIRAKRGGVAFSGKRRLGYAACLWSRTATRVLEEITRGHARTPDDLYRLTQRVDWGPLLTPRQSLAVHTSLNSPRFNHSRFVSQRVKDAIVDQFRDRTGQRPDVDLRDPDLPLKAVIQNERVTLSRDLAGTSLHKRGWRPVQVKSPLNEAIAAGLLQLSGWTSGTPLCDPLCGSGTFLIEAAHIAGDRAPGLRRTFAFERWTDLDQRCWAELKQDAERRWREGRARIGPLSGNDRHGGALQIARDSAARAEVADLITFHEGDIGDYVPPQRPAFVVSNPPFGVRLGEGEDLENSWYRLGVFLKERCPGSQAWILSGDPALSRKLHMKTGGRHPVMNGPLDCRWLKYDIRDRPQ